MKQKDIHGEGTGLAPAPPEAPPVAADACPRCGGPLGYGTGACVDRICRSKAVR